jgi:hypothetical protein
MIDSNCRGCSCNLCPSSHNSDLCQPASYEYICEWSSLSRCYMLYGAAFHARSSIACSFCIPIALLSSFAFPSHITYTRLRKVSRIS